MHGAGHPWGMAIVIELNWSVLNSEYQRSFLHSASA